MSGAARKVVYTGPDYGVELAAETLGEGFDLLPVAAEAEVLHAALSGAAALLDASMKVRVTAQAIENAPQLRLITCATTGATHIDLTAAERRGIEVLTLKGQSELLGGLTPAAELSWALIMACARRIRAAQAHVQAGGWERTLFPGMMLKGRTIGLIGFGRLGRWVARYAQAFGMEVLFHDPYQTGAPDFARPVSLEDLAALADVISVHVHVTPETEGMVDAALIAKFRRGVIFVNTSRGEVTDEAALLAALQSGQIGAMGLDVLCDEPQIRDSGLWRYAQEHDNLLITPHIGGYSPDAVKQVVAFSARRIRGFFA